MADETSSLVLKVDSTSAKAATRDLENLTASSAKAEAAAGKLGTTSSTAARAVQEHGAATATAATQAAELAETEEQAAKRIHDMIQASLAATQASNARAAAENAAAQASRVTGAAQAENAAAASKLVQVQNAQMAASSRAVAAQVQYERVLATTAGTEAELEAAEMQLNRLRSAGSITATEYAAAVDRLAKAKLIDAAATKVEAASEKTGLNSRAQAEIATAASEVLSGNFSRLRRTGAAFANQTGLLTKLMSPLGLAIVGAAGAAVLLTKAFADGENEASAYSKALILTGNYAGETAAQLQVMAKSVGESANTTQHAAAAVVAQVTQTGKFYGDQIKTVSEAAIELQKTTGQAVDKTIADFEKLGKDPVHGILDLNQSMHFLTQATYDQITALVQRGQIDKAAQVAQDAYANAVKSRAEKVQSSLGTLETAWNGIAGAAKGAWDAMLDIGRPTTLQDKIDTVNAQIAIAQKQFVDPVTGTAINFSDREKAAREQTIKNLQEQLRNLQNQQRAQGGFAAGQSLSDRLIEERINAQQSLGEGAGASAQDKLNARLNDLAEQKAKALMGVVDPATRDHIIAQFNAQVAEAAHQYNSAEKKLNPTGPKTNPLSGLQGLVNSTGVSSLIVPNNQPVTEYVQTVAKLTNAFDEARAKGADLGQAENLFAQGVAAANLKLKEQQNQIANGNDRVFAQFKATLDDQIAAQKNAIDIQVASVGMGQKEAERLRELNQLDQQRIQQVQRLAREQVTHPEQYAALQRQIDAVNASFRDMTETRIDGFRRMDEAQGEWSNGFTSALQDFADQAANVAGQTHDLFLNAFNGMADGIANFVQTGKFNMADFMRSFLADLTRMEARILISQVLTSIFMRSGTTIASNYMAGGGASYAASGVNWNVGVLGSANGNVFSGPGIAAYENQIVTRPTYFANGGNVMGEAGPEAIMPLSRGSDGKLGVKAQVGGNVYLNVEVKGGDGNATVSQSQTTDAQGNKMIDLIIDQASERAVNKVNSNIGRGGSTGQVIQQTFGLSRRGVPVAG